MSVSVSPTPSSVLLVDDDDGVREFLRRQLEASNVVVTEAASGEEALRIVDDSFDLVILDIGLPGIDGFTVLRLLRERFQFPIIVVSGAGEEAERVLGLEIGADDYVVKPFLPRDSWRGSMPNSAGRPAQSRRLVWITGSSSVTS